VTEPRPPTAELCYDCTPLLLGPEVSSEDNHFAGKVQPGQVLLDICDGCGIHRFDHRGRRTCRQDGPVRRWCPTCVGETAREETP
jgi:hypothetical protein